MPTIKVVKGQHTGQVHSIAEESMTIGRDKNDAVQVLDQGVSRSHAEIFQIGELFFIRDLDSKNGTFLNEEQITEQALQIGDRIRIGSTHFLFEDESLTDADSKYERQVQYEVDERAPSSTIEISFAKELMQESSEGSSEVESRHLQILFQISKVFSTTHGIRPIYERVVKLLLDAVEGDNGYIFELNDRGSLIPVMVVEKEVDKTAKVSKSIIKQVVDHQKAILTHDAAMDPRFQCKSSVIIQKTSSVICAPLIAMDRMVGVIYISVARVMQPFESKDLELASVVAILLGTVMQSVASAKKEKSSQMNMVKTLVDIKERRFPKRKGHSERVAHYAKAIAAEMDFNEETIHRVELAAWLHDIGRVSSAETDELDDPTAPPEFLRKKATEHAKLAQEIVQDMQLEKEVQDGIVYHGETLDGKGVPKGLHGLDIPIYARIIAVAKAFDSLISYGGTNQDGLAIKDALIQMNKESGKQYDSEIIQALLVAYRKGALFKSPDSSDA